MYSLSCTSCCFQQEEGRNRTTPNDYSDGIPNKIANDEESKEKEGQIERQARRKIGGRQR